MHRNGSLLDSTEAVLGLDRSMTSKGKHPTVSLVETDYAPVVKLTAGERMVLEAELVRLPSLEKWSVTTPRKRGGPRRK